MYNQQFLLVLQTRTLQDNYRSTGVIVEASQAILGSQLGFRLRALGPRGSHIGVRAVRDMYAEAEAIVSQLKELTHRAGVEPGQVAILLRLNRQARPIEAALVG